MLDALAEFEPVVVCTFPREFTAGIDGRVGTYMLRSPEELDSWREKICSVPSVGEIIVESREFLPVSQLNS